MESIYDYFRANGTELGKRIVETYPALHRSSDPSAPEMEELLRPLFQRRNLPSWASRSIFSARVQRELWPNAAQAKH